MKDKSKIELYIRDICNACNEKGFEEHCFGSKDRPYNAEGYLILEKDEESLGVRLLLLELQDKVNGHKGHWSYINSLGLINRGFCPYCGETPISNDFSFTHYGYKTNICESCVEKGKMTQKALKAKGGCYIATVCYGDEQSQNVILLKWYRDAILNNNRLGKSFIRFYYILSPSIASKLKNKESINYLIIKLFLDPIVKYIKKRYKK